MVIIYFKLIPEILGKHHLCSTLCKYKRGPSTSRCSQSSEDRQENTYLNYKSIKTVLWRQRIKGFAPEEISGSRLNVL